MEALQETTVWTTDYQPNHIYLLDGSKMLAYIKAGTKSAIYFSKPMQFDRKGRSFVTLKKNPFKQVQAKSSTVKVAGSNGKVYEVDPEAKTCTCPGFNFRGNCKHLAEVAK
jgi:hypothetical protein